MIASWIEILAEGMALAESNGVSRQASPLRCAGHMWHASYTAS